MSAIEHPYVVIVSSWRRPEVEAVELKVGAKHVHVVDDNAGFCKAIEALLKQFGYQVSTYPTAQHLLDRLPSDHLPSCILLDVRLPGMTGPELQQRLLELGSTIPIIFLTGYADTATTVKTIKAGGEDFLIKPVSSDQLLPAVERAVAHHHAVLDQKRAREVIFSRIATLTPRERQVFELVIRGGTNKHVARALGCTERTIKAHRHNMIEKMQVRSLAELVSLAERVGVSMSATRPTVG
jgi:FixJ family two-component response regulator